MRSVYVQGNAAGATNVALYDASKKLIGTIIVQVRVDFGELQEAIDRAVPYPVFHRIRSEKGIAISAAFVAYFYQRGKAESLASEVTQAQLMLLQSQLEPHMLFNTLAHLRALIGHDTERALVMLDHLNDYLRTTLQASRQPLHPLTDEFSRLGDYLSLMAIRMGPRLVFELDLPPALSATPVPSFILQPLVENAIRHGLEPQVSGGRIEVQARAEGAQLLLTVRDNGLGISELALADAARPLQADGTHTGPSWGLSHVRQRLHTLYGPRSGMHISPLPTGGTCVVLALPLDIPHCEA